MQWIWSCGSQVWRWQRSFDLYGLTLVDRLVWICSERTISILRLVVRCRLLPRPLNENNREKFFHLPSRRSPSLAPLRAPRPRRLQLNPLFQSLLHLRLHLLLPRRLYLRLHLLFQGRLHRSLVLLPPRAPLLRNPPPLLLIHHHHHLLLRVPRPPKQSRSLQPRLHRSKPLPFTHLLPNVLEPRLATAKWIRC